MKASRFIAGKLGFGGKLAMVPIAVSFLIMIVAVAISSGFREELRSGIASLSGDIQITPPDMNYMGEVSPVELQDGYFSLIGDMEEVVRTEPVVYRAGIVNNDGKIAGVIFKGMAGMGDSLKVSIPSRLADQLGLGEGDSMLAYFVGERIKARKFKVDSVYDSVLGGDENLIVFAGLTDMQRLSGWSAQEVSALEVILDSEYRDSESVRRITEEIGTGILLGSSEDESTPIVSSALNRYPQIFAWLDLIDFNVMVILLLMTVVAGFNMISGLLIMLFRNISTIGTLKSMGMTDRDISAVFLRVSSSIVLKGMAAGSAIGLLLCFIQDKTHIIRLNPENYFISYVPVKVDPLQLLGADLMSYLLIMLLLLIPCLFVSRVDPAKTVRAQ